MPRNPHLLYLTPVVPASTGTGLAMRARMVLWALSRQCRVSLFVVPLYDGRTDVPAATRELCGQIAVLPSPPAGAPSPLGPLLQGSIPNEAIRGVLSGWGDTTFDVLHTFRLAMAPLARPYLHTLECHLDLDIIESKTRRRLAALYRLNGRRMEAGVEQVLARRFEALEDQALADFDRVYVCFDGDREELLDRSLNPAGSARAEVVVLPNAVSIPGPLPPRPKDGPFTFLFMGTLSYYPNEDALRYFCADVLPSLRQCAAREFRLNVLGPGATDAIKRLEELPEVQFVGEVPDVRPWYRDADAVVVPLRAGGGTRIKILEAFSYRTPVVSTSIGLEGIDARDDEHALVADTPESFTAQCLRLMTEEDLAERLTERAYALFLRAYSPGAVVRAILPCHPPHPQPLSRISGEGSDEPQD